MKKIIPLMFAASLVATIGSCGPSKAEQAEAARQDSIRVADSLAQVEAARIEALRLDSIRKDSLLRVATPSLKQFVSISNEYGLALQGSDVIVASLKKKGFSVLDSKTKSGYDEVMDDHYTLKDYVLKSDSLANINVSIKGEYIGGNISISFGNSKAKDIFMKSVTDAGFKKNIKYPVESSMGDYSGSAYGHKKNRHFSFVEIKELGNTVYIEAGGTY